MPKCHHSLPEAGRRFAYVHSMCCLLWLCALLACLPHAMAATEIEVTACSDIPRVEQALREDHVTARFAKEVQCDEWETIEVNALDRELRIEALDDDEHAADSSIALRNIRFDVGPGALTSKAGVSMTWSPHYPLLNGFLQIGDGGALHVHDEGTVVFLGDLEVDGIEVQGSGGGVYIDHAIVEVHGRASFTNLWSEEDGGAVHIAQGGSLVVYGGLVATRNGARNNGGAIFNHGHLRIEELPSAFEENYAAIGSALYNGAEANGAMFFSRAKFEDNGVNQGWSGEHVYSENYLFFGEGVKCSGGESAINIENGLVEIEGGGVFTNFTDGAINVMYEPIFTNLEILDPLSFKNNIGGAGGCSNIAYQQLDGQFACAPDSRTL